MHERNHFKLYHHPHHLIVHGSWHFSLMSAILDAVLPSWDSLALTPKLCYRLLLVVFVCCSLNSATVCCLWFLRVAG